MMGGRENPKFDMTEPGEVETLSYIIDMINGLMEMASQTRSNTLLAILNAALIEARTQKSEAERKATH